jgi:hypothetical protein
MKRNKLPPTISLEFLLNECKKQEQREKKIEYRTCVTETLLEIVNKDI